MAIAELFLNLHNYKSTLNFSENDDWELGAIASLFPLNFDETGNQLKAILEKRYTDGISGFEGVKVQGSKIVGVFYDIVSPSLTKKFNFSIDATSGGVDYTQIDTGSLEQNFSEYNFAAPAKKSKQCIEGKSSECTRSDGSTYCIKLGYKCKSVGLNESEKAIAKSITNKIQVSPTTSVPVLRSGVADVPVSELNLDPQRFQYKLVHGKTGVSGSLTGVKKFDPELAGIVQVWQDPADGKTYVINGHNRVNLAKDAGTDEVTVRFIKAKSAEEARSVGALTNIAEGRGNALDAAKFFRDTGLTQQDLEAKGIPLREKIATDGIALASLNDGLFQRVAVGEMPVERAVVIGAKVKDPQLQSDLVKLIEDHEKKGKKVTNDTISELADDVNAAPTKEEGGGLLGLLGFEPNQRSLAIEKAEVQSDIKRRLSREKKLFGVVSKSTAAKQLEKAGNKIDIEGSKQTSQSADLALRVFDQEKTYTGAISTALNKAAGRIADGENPKKVKDETYAEILKQIQETYSGGKRSGVKRSEDGDGSPAGQGSLF
ncbi:hypothetical protein [Nostoc sp.]|uniref:hypothetical protein n=1 Tax=Nostoc sp. TaxID=1180 RepID=UPI002FF921E4